MPTDATELLNALSTPALPTPPEEIAPDLLEADTLEWAKDVLWVRHNLGATKAQAKKWGGFRLALWEYAKDNKLDYVSNMLPRAAAVIERYKSKNADSSIITDTENRETAEIERILDAAIKEATAVE